MQTIQRYIETILQKWLFKEKALILTGARQVGKTTALKHLLFKNKKVLWLNADEDIVRERLEKINIENLKNIIGNYEIVIIDEIQRIKNAGLLLKILVDNFKKVQVIATGSSALDISEKIFEPLTGRHLLFHLYPFSIAEIYKQQSAFEVEQLLPFHLVFGSYPDIYNNKTDAALLLNNLANQYLYKDVLVWKDIRKPELLNKLLKLLAYQIGSEVSFHELAKQLQVKSETIESYINLLEKCFVIYRLSSYSNNARKEVSKMSKIFFWDNGIRNAIVNNYDDLNQRNDVGQLWENYIISERMKANAYKQTNIASYFWRNYNQSEVDYIEVNKKEILAFEMKWNNTQSIKKNKAFSNAYPNAVFDVITPENFIDFVSI